MAILWLSSSYGYYLMQFQLKYVKGDLFLNGMFTAFSEMSAMIFSAIIFRIVGFKKALVISFMISIAAQSILILYQENGHSNLVFSILMLFSMFGVASALNLSWIGNNTLFPASMKATSFGICSVFARMFSMGAPLFAELKPVTISQFTFIGLCLTAAIASVFIR